MIYTLILSNLFFKDENLSGQHLMPLEMLLIKFMLKILSHQSKYKGHLVAHFCT